MKNVISYENLRNFAYSNDKICKGEVKGIVLFFYGLGCTDIKEDNTDEGKFFAGHGIIYIIPYLNPWNWMNAAAVKYTDKIIDVIMKKYNLPQNIPIVSSGLSMGGLACLVYSAKAKITPVADVANCPVCDLPYHYTERPDLPRTLLSAFGDMDLPLDEALKTASPLHMTDKMPDIDYYIYCCEKDDAVNCDKHGKRFTDKMRKNGFRVIFRFIPDRGHCKLTDEANKQFLNDILGSIFKTEE